MCLFIAKYSGFEWLIIVGSEFVDWMYWHFFTTAVNYNSSHIELLLNALRLLSDESSLDLQMNSLLQLRRPEYKSPCRTINYPPVMLSRESVFTDLLHSNDSFVATRCSGNVITDPLLSNGLPLWFHYSGFQAVLTEPLPSNVLFRYSILQYISVLSGHRQVIHLYIQLFLLLLFLLTLANVLHMTEVV
jgi:hypothetical protein